MKKLVSMLLASVMTFSTFGMVAFADDGQQAEPAGNRQVATQSKTYDISKCKLYLDNDTFMYDPAEGKSYETNEHFASVDAILSQIDGDIFVESQGEFSDVIENCSFKIGNTNYKYGDKKNEKIYLKPGKYMLTITANAPNTGTVQLPFEIRPFKMTAKYEDMDKDVGIETNQFTYNGKAKCPRVAVYFYYNNSKGQKDIRLKEGTDYTVSYKYKNNKYYGKGSVSWVVTFKGRFSGTIKKTETIYIVPKGTCVTSAKAGKKSVKVKWKKTKDASGYKVEVYKISKSWNSTAKLVKSRTVKGRKKTKCTITGLKRHTKYYVVARAYKTVKGKKVVALGGAKNFRTK